MFRKKWKFVAAAMAAVLVLGACGSAKSSSGGGGGGGFTIGVLTDATGLASTNDASSVKGVEAAVDMFNKEGYHLKYVVGDTQSSPSGALAAAQKLVDQDHAFAIVAVSALTFSAAPWLKSHNIPVIGADEDSNEWISDLNMFSVFGYSDFSIPVTTYGSFLKKLGATNLASLGYGISPSSADAAKAMAVSAEHAGIKAGYVNANVPFDSTNMQPLALAMKSAKVDSVMPAMETNTNLALLVDLEQLGVHLKASFLSTGYGDLYNDGPEAEREAKGIDFLTEYEPAEMNTPATKKLVSALKTYAGLTTPDPTFGEYIGYVSVDAFVDGLKAAGKNPSPKSFITTMQGITNFDGAGLWGARTLSFAPSARHDLGVAGCTYAAQWTGKKFTLVPGGNPICGSALPNEKVS